MSERRWARKQVLQSADFAATCREIKRLLKGFEYCLVGGLAVSVYANPPVTVDVDILVVAAVTDLRLLFSRFGKAWTSSSLWFPSRRSGVPTGGLNVSRENPHVDVDLLATGSDSFLVNAVRDARNTKLQTNLWMPVILPEDLVIMKSLVGRDKDIDDVVAISRSMKLDLSYVDMKINELL
jgi:predicted nucleotidyltransferase